MSDQLITLVTKEGTKITTSHNFKNLSNLIQNVLEDSGPNEEIPIEYVSEDTLRRILEFAEHHQFIAPAPPKKPIPSRDISKAIEDQWDVSFIKSFDDNKLTELILSVNYLDMKSLLDICCACIAARFKERSVEELREEYHVQEEFTLEVEQALKAEHPWVLEADYRNNYDKS
ncbi:unnamed protein product [Blepharisma stoltei]|uniref:SKP1-like protein n=1 Tax=Blepharisma stoltei TaxID=1481888 RepID=A0AAU9J8U5_9CILI|nr:unnamed protein product [Blepharisma stoltei]